MKYPAIYSHFSRNVIDILKYGGVGVIPTDTIYGIVGSALKKETVERIYRLRARNTKKPMIVLIGTITDLKKFGVKIDAKTKKILNEIWVPKKGVHPRPTSVILRLYPSAKGGFTSGGNPYTLTPNLSYLHRGKGSIAFRLPTKKSLRNLLKKTGPLVAPSANLAGHPPAKTIHEAKKYFHDRVDFYMDEGKIEGNPSRLIEIVKDRIAILRK